MQRARGAGAFGADTWDAGATTDADAAGEADVVPEATTNSAVWGTNTWQFAIHDPHAPDVPDASDRSPSGWGDLTPETVDRGEPPPDEAD